MQNTLCKKRNITVDLFRMVAAVLVVLIHTTQGQNTPLLYFISVTVGRYAVPFFMIVTGYYYFLNPSKERLHKILLNILSLWGIWMIIYLPHGISVLFGFHNMRELILHLGWSLIGETPCFGGSWYLTALAFGLIVVDYFRKKKKMWICTILAIISWFICCISTNYEYVLPYFGIFNNLYWATTIITGVLWITIAYFIAKNHLKLKKLGSIYFLLFAITLTMLERLIIQHFWIIRTDRTDMYITLPISVMFVFSFVIKHCKLQTASKVIFYRDLATLIYFVQFGVIMIVKFSGIFNFIIVLGLTLFLSICIIVISKKIKWMRKLYI